MLVLALALVAAPALPVTQRGPFVEMQAGPQVLFRGSGVGSGPEVRLDLGLGVTEKIAFEAWISGALENAPLRAPGDQSRLGAGLAARARLYQFDPEGKVALWGRAGAGFAATTPGQSGPLGFGGAQILWQPFVKRFAFGLEADALLLRGGAGFAVLPSLRCAL
jgi:hypothetical protein